VVRDAEKEKYESTAALLAASAAMGECIPPSLAMLVLGSVTSLSVASLFAAGLIPAAVIAAILCRPSGCRVRVGRAHWAADEPPGIFRPDHVFHAGAAVRRHPARSSRPPSLRVRGGGVLLIAAVVYREMKPGDFRRMVAEASTSSGMVLFTLAAAQSFSWVLSRLGAIDWPSWSRSTRPVPLFLLVSIVTLIVSARLEGLPAILILAPFWCPRAGGERGSAPWHVLLVAMGIGAFLPPLGVGFTSPALWCGRMQIEPRARWRRISPYWSWACSSSRSFRGSRSVTAADAPRHNSFTRKVRNR
jgi:hypothetical protein